MTHTLLSYQINPPLASSDGARSAFIKHAFTIALVATLVVMLTVAVRQTFTQYQFGGADLVPLWLSSRVAAALLALMRRRDALAGAALALACAKPQMSFLIVPALLWWSWHQRRLTVLTSFALTMLVLFAFTLSLWHTWPSEWLARVM